MSATLVHHGTTTQYARTGSAHIAYQVCEARPGQPDLVVLPGFVSNVELVWQLPGFASFHERLATFSRLIVFDKRGTGLSDRVPMMQDMTERSDDLLAVIDTARAKRPALFAISEGVPLALWFAAHHPERVDQLVLYGGFDDATVALPGERDRECATVRERWGEGRVFSALAPSWSADPEMVRMLGRYERHSASPSVAADLVAQIARTDVSAVLPSITVPTTVIHRTGDTMLSIERARRLAREIPHARLVELEGRDHLVYAGDVDAVVDVAEACITGSKTAAPSPDRRLATMLLIDIVASTRRATLLGDRSWTSALGQFYDVVTDIVASAGGAVVKTTGDGCLVTLPTPSMAINVARSIRRWSQDMGLTLRAGIHTGEVEHVAGDLAGVGVHITARIAAAAHDGEVWVSRTIADLVSGTSVALVDRGAHVLAGIDRPWELLAVAE